MRRASLSAAITLPSAMRPLLICTPSLNCCPDVPVSFTRSLPARRAHACPKHGSPAPACTPACLLGLHTPSHSSPTARTGVAEWGREGAGSHARQGRAGGAPARSTRCSLERRKRWLLGDDDAVGLRRCSSCSVQIACLQCPRMVSGCQSEQSASYAADNLMKFITCLW